MTTQGHIHIIAEAGTTHEGSAATACRLVDAAKTTGADSVKFQLIDPPKLYLTKLRQNGALLDNPAVAVRNAQRLTPNEWNLIAMHAARKDILFSASVFDAETLKFLDAFDPPYVKIASTDLTNPPLLRAAAQSGRKVLLSTGMGTLGEIEQAVTVLNGAGAQDVVLMHCVSVYPCPTEISNVRFVETLRHAFDLPVGFSDHTESSEAAIAAVALGATWLEKHMTLDRNACGFDHAYAMEPDMLTDYIRQIRNVEAALDRPSKKVAAVEETVMSRARRGLWAARDLEVGGILTEADILAVRPAGPLTPVDLPRVVGRRIRHEVLQSEAIRLEDLA